MTKTLGESVTINMAKPVMKPNDVLLQISKGTDKLWPGVISTFQFLKIGQEKFTKFTKILNYIKSF